MAAATITSMQLAATSASEDLLLARIRNKMQSTYVRPVRPNLSKEKQAGHRC